MLLWHRWGSAQDHEHSISKQAQQRAGTPALSGSEAFSSAGVDTPAGDMHDKNMTTHALPTRRRGKPVAVVKQGSAAVPIYKGDVRGSIRFTVAFYRNGQRERRTFATLDAARDEARMAALNSGHPQLLPCGCPHQEPAQRRADEQGHRHPLPSSSAALRLPGHLEATLRRRHHLRSRSSAPPHARAGTHRRPTQNLCAAD